MPVRSQCVGQPGEERRADTLQKQEALFLKRGAKGGGHAGHGGWVSFRTVGVGKWALSLERKAGFGPETDFVELALQVCLANRREPVVGDQLVSLADDLGDGGFAAGEAVQCPIPVRGVVQHGAGHEFIQGQLPVAAGDSCVVYGQAPAGVERVAVGHYGLAAQQGVKSA